MANDDSSPLTEDTREAGTPLIHAARAQVAAARLRREALVASGRLPGSSSNDSPQLPTKTLPNYSLIRELHRGGQGIVYLALQESTDRQVALKVFHHGTIEGTAELARFEREVEVLSRLKHPNVVTIHDCGRSDDEVYLVMDYVAGRPLDTHMAQEKPTFREALGLFAKICDGVSAAHLRGVIHRDLKPSNIRIDEVGEPRILDFGLAKLEQNAPGASFADAMTMTGQFVGSLPWASPEQAEGRSNDLDVRTDVYSLGVIFYQLLTGKFPYPVGGRMDDVVRHIATTDPAHPSTIDRTIGNDVGTILLKCLAKEPVRRYQSAGDLARDIRRYLAGEPIEAKRDSMTYVLRRYLTRYKFAATGAAAFILVLIASSAISFAYWRNAEASRNAEQEQRRRAESINQFVTKALRSSDPNQGGKQGMLVADAMQEAVAEIEAGAFKDDPRLEASLLRTISTILNSNARSEQALDLAQRALKIHEAILPAGDPESATSLNIVAVCLITLGRYDEALPKFQAVLEVYRRALPEDGPEVAMLVHNIGGCLRWLGRPREALVKYEEALAMRQRLFPGDHADVAASLTDSAGCLRAVGRTQEALSRHTAAIAMYERLYEGDHPHLAMALNNAAYSLDVLGRSSEALPLYERADKMRRGIFQDDHPDLAQGLNNVAAHLFAQERYAEALPRAEAAYDMYQRLFPGDHPSVGRGLGNVGVCLLSLGRAEEGLPRMTAALEMHRRIHVGDHPDIAMALSMIGSCKESLGDPAAALEGHEAALKMRQRIYSGDHPAVAKGLINLAGCRLNSGHAKEAEPLLRDALAMHRRLFKNDHFDVAKNLDSLATSLCELGRAAEAEPLAREAVDMNRRLFSGDRPSSAHAMSTLAICAQRSGNSAEAQQLIEDASAMILRIEAPDPTMRSRILDRRRETLGE